MCFGGVIAFPCTAARGRGDSGRTDNRTTTWAGIGQQHFELKSKVRDMPVLTMWDRV